MGGCFGFYRLLMRYIKGFQDADGIDRKPTAGANTTLKCLSSYNQASSRQIAEPPKAYY